MDAMSSSPFRVVVVDDHAPFRRAVRDLLLHRGCEVVGEAGCGRAARALVEQLRPDAVLLDVRLGAENGLDVARALLHEHPGLAVVLVSADPDSATREHARAAGARGFVSKWRLAEADLAALWRCACPA
jgi:DNA-binding NarL/FixJ family response regulator